MSPELLSRSGKGEEKSVRLEFRKSECNSLSKHLYFYEENNNVGEIPWDSLKITHQLRALPTNLRLPPFPSALKTNVRRPGSYDRRECR